MASGPTVLVVVDGAEVDVLVTVSLSVGWAFEVGSLLQAAMTKDRTIREKRGRFDKVCGVLAGKRVTDLFARSKGHVIRAGVGIRNYRDRNLSNGSSSISAAASVCSTCPSMALKSTGSWSSHGCTRNRFGTADKVMPFGSMS